MAPKKTPHPDRFWKYVEKTDYCWLWTGGLFRDGYGMFTVDRVTFRSHRFSWELHNGKIKKGLQVLHKCDNPPCVNPAHLFLGTNQDNVDDRHQKGRTRAGDNHRSTKFSSEIISQIKNLKGIKKQCDIAKDFGISRPHINNIFSGKRRKKN